MAAHATIEQVAQESVWSATARMPRAPKLRQDMEVDVAVVGAGMAGLTTAYLLTQIGKTVVVLDDGPLAGGMTEATSAHLASAIDDRYFEIERLHGQEGARLAAESHSAAIDRIEAIAQKERINCDFARLDGYLFLTPSEKVELLDRELEAAHRAGLGGVAKLERAPLESFNTGPCLRFPNQAQFHPLKYLAGLAKAIKRDGGRLFTDSHVDRIDGGTPAQVKVGKHMIRAEAVVVATNTPINDLVAIHTKQAAYMTYVIGARVPRGSVVQALYWDTGPISKQGRSAAYHYVRLQNPKRPTKAMRGAPSHDLLIIGGEDHRTGQIEEPHEPHARLEAWAREHFPMIESIEFAWGGQVMETIDGLAFIGRNPMDHESVFIVTGDSGMGLTHGTIAGMLLTDLIQGKENAWAKLYDPSRKTLRAAGRYVRESLNAIAQYADWVTAGDVDSVEEIENESGAVVRRGLSKVAVYRDELGAIHERSAVCNHLGCIVQWNSTEKTWDCPCHGSRFDKVGKVINGPANQDLAAVKSGSES